jgi:signal transduction histidine kinase
MRGPALGIRPDEVDPIPTAGCRTGTTSLERPLRGDSSGEPSNPTTGPSITGPNSTATLPCPSPENAGEHQPPAADQRDVSGRAEPAREPALRQPSKGDRKLAAKLLHAQEEERRRIAREMHDDWTQRLALLCIDSVKLEQQIGLPESALPLLHAMQSELIRLSEDVHALSRQLHPSILDDLGLVEALRSECASFSRREGITIDYRPERVPTTVPRAVALCVYRVAQEALRNVAKHAAVNEVLVTLVATGPALVLRVEDRGVGFDPAAVRSEPGLGLSGMEERVRLVRAQLAISSAPGRGTTVEVRIPWCGGNHEQAAHPDRR